MTTQTQQKLVKVRWQAVVVSEKVHRALSRYCEEHRLKPKMKTVVELALKRFFESETFSIEEHSQGGQCQN